MKETRDDNERFVSAMPQTEFESNDVDEALWSRERADRSPEETLKLLCTSISGCASASQSEDEAARGRLSTENVSSAADQLEELQALRAPMGPQTHCHRRHLEDTPPSPADWLPS